MRCFNPTGQAGRGSFLPSQGCVLPGPRAGPAARGANTFYFQTPCHAVAHQVTPLAVLGDCEDPPSAPWHFFKEEVRRVPGISSHETKRRHCLSNRLAWLQAFNAQQCCLTNETLCY